MERILFGDRDYPAALRELDEPPERLTLWRPLEEGRVVAIVGARAAEPAAIRYTRKLAACLARAGIIVASGGAIGIDRAAHEGALGVPNGRTWLFAPCGIDHAIPRKNAAVYAKIKKRAGSNILSLFEDGERGGRRAQYFRRNAAMAAMASDVVCVQAGCPSGALNTMKHARELRRRRWVPQAHPFGGDGRMAGCDAERGRGALELPAEPDDFLQMLLGDGAPELPSSAPSALDDEESRVLSALTTRPRHPDDIALEVGLSAPSVTTALLTLALKDVVVEGPGGFFRRH